MFSAQARFSTSPPQTCGPVRASLAYGSLVGNRRGIAPNPFLPLPSGHLVMSRGAAHFVQTMAWANTICHKLRCGLPSHVKTSYSRTSSHQQMRGWDPTTGWSVRNEHPNLSNHHLNAVLHLTNQHTHNMELCMVIVMSNMISWENARYISRLQSSPAFLLKARLFRHTFPNGATGEK